MAELENEVTTSSVHVRWERRSMENVLQKVLSAWKLQSNKPDDLNSRLKGLLRKIKRMQNHIDSLEARLAFA